VDANNRIRIGRLPKLVRNPAVASRISPERQRLTTSAEPTATGLLPKRSRASTSADRTNVMALKTITPSASVNASTAAARAGPAVRPTSVMAP
jgi:hypothetical protein